MNSYFARYPVDKVVEGFGNDDNSSAVYVSWPLRGGEAGRVWAEKISSQIEDADNKAQE
ncbi:MAG: hypothetical protein AAFQ15_14100 [Pseudomonadota bacterium]